ncbi:MAG: DUF3237 domain-containing protein [Hyphomicrobiaceae bacterium]|nr:DUF3237 domain-containing protein [Hyphomicrobiaceae bacterium]
MNPKLSHVFDIVAEVGPMRDLGAMPHGRRRMVPILGGTVRGPRLQAEVVPGGADWQYVRGDGIVELVARYAIRTQDGTGIAVTNRGLRRAAPEVMARLARGEAVDATLVYCRTVPQFEAPTGPHAWLNASLFVGDAVRLPDAVQVAVFEVL